MVVNRAVIKLEQLIAQTITGHAGRLISYGERITRARAHSLTEFIRRLEILRTAGVETRLVELQAVTREIVPFGKIHFYIDYFATLSDANTLKGRERYPLVASYYHRELFQDENLNEENVL